MNNGHWRMPLENACPSPSLDRIQSSCLLSTPAQVVHSAMGVAEAKAFPMMHPTTDESTRSTAFQSGVNQLITDRYLCVLIIFFSAPKLMLGEPVLPGGH